MLPGKLDFTATVERGVAPLTRKQRVLAAISNLFSAFFTGYKNKICTYYKYIYTSKEKSIKINAKIEDVGLNED